MRSTGRDAAFGRRQPIRATARRYGYKLARGMSFGGHFVPDYLHFHPRVGTKEDLADLSARVRWYLPELPVPVYVDGASEFVVDPAGAPHMDPKLVVDPGWSPTRPVGAPLHVYWKLSVRTAPKFATQCRRAEIADPQMFFISDSGYVRLRHRFSLDYAPDVDDVLGRVFAGGAPRRRSAFVLATGPSAQLVDPSNVNDDVRITCNSAVRDRDLISSFNPTFIAFADPVFHYGPSRYAAAFRTDLLRALDETDTTIVTIDQWASVLLANVPEARGRTLVLRSEVGRAWTIPTADAPFVRHTGNILTNLMLPLAMAMADRVRIAGCDGRQPSENYFWRHNQQTQYSGALMETAFNAHPAFFRDRDYADYYDQHCRELAALLTYGESKGRAHEPVTPSWIPALATRGAPAFDARAAAP